MNEYVTGDILMYNGTDLQQITVTQNGILSDLSDLSDKADTTLSKFESEFQEKYNVNFETVMKYLTPILKKEYPEDFI